MNKIDYTNLYRAYYAWRRRWHSGVSLWVVAILVEVIIVLIVGAIVFASIVVISRARVENIPMTGIPSIDAGIYPDAHVEEIEDDQSSKKIEEETNYGTVDISTERFAILLDQAIDLCRSEEE